MRPLIAPPNLITISVHRIIPLANPLLATLVALPPSCAATSASAAHFVLNSAHVLAVQRVIVRIIWFSTTRTYTQLIWGQGWGVYVGLLKTIPNEVTRAALALPDDKCSSSFAATFSPDTKHVAASSAPCPLTQHYSGRLLSPSSSFVVVTIPVSNQDRLWVLVFSSPFSGPFYFL